MLRKIVNNEKLTININNTSLATKGVRVLTHRLQHLTTCLIQNGQRGSGNMQSPRLLNPKPHVYGEKRIWVRKNIKFQIIGR